MKQKHRWIIVALSVKRTNFNDSFLLYKHLNVGIRIAVAPWHFSNAVNFISTEIWYGILGDNKFGRNILYFTVGIAEDAVGGSCRYTYIRKFWIQ